VVSGNRSVMSDYIDAINKLLRARVSANHPEQYSIIAALDGDQSHLTDVNNRLKNRLEITMNKLATIPGISLVRPDGAFYAFPSIDVEDDAHFCKELLKETGVVVVPGSGFGQKPGSHHFRIVILPPEEVLNKAFDRITEFYAKYKS
ncbi:MAG TPA: aminotransferase class I/II-fold pyridoxal phosphate-dependent enzyme, partial [Candidatus Kapabacteria bacterium]|nr:aminotransferase class I/II-fold pyridoxal phosphate-dependent enzyme [Candidatus Kapabacteria bacterium]